MQRFSPVTCMMYMLVQPGRACTVDLLRYTT